MKLQFLDPDSKFIDIIKNFLEDYLISQIDKPDLFLFSSQDHRLAIWSCRFSLIGVYLLETYPMKLLVY